MNEYSEATQKVIDNTCSGYYPEVDHDFLIVEGWETVHGDNNDYKPTEEFLKALAELTGYNPEEHTFDGDFWGFSDEYSTCGECGNVIRTSPTSYGWTPDYWLSDCEILCGNCVRSDPDDYIEWLTEQTDSAHGCHLVDPTEHGFTLVLQGLENGMHHGQADDPIAIQGWARENGLAVLWVTRSGQFDVSFNGYFAWRGCPECRYFDVECLRCDNTSDRISLNDTEKQAILGVLVEYTKDYGCIGQVTYLKPDFRESPDLATRMQAALKSLSKPYARIANDGSVREYDTIEEYMEGGS